MITDDQSNLDSDDFWLELGVSLELPPDTLAELRSLVLGVRDTIYLHKLNPESSATGRSRKELTVYLKRLSRRLARVIELLEARDRNTETLLSSILYDWLSQHLTNEAFDQLLGTTIPRPRPSFHDLESHEAQAWHGPQRVYDDHARRQRREVAAQRASDLVIGLLRDLKLKVDRQLEIRRLARGGSPGRVPRNLVVQELAQHFPNLFGESPTPALGGKFTELCQIILEAMNEPTDGIEEAVRRTLDRLSKV